ncbi:MAG TPA: shikimate kinase [Jatrophihabitans sp.]|nr:shikimate kinase [Jatrophihabitans sp.]
MGSAPDQAGQAVRRPRAVLIGLPGTGKSSVGARLAGRLSVSFADSDRLVVQLAGRSVAEIFATDGEPAFRRLEAAVVLEALTSFDGVLALGGGAVTTERVRAGLARSGVPVVLLTAAAPELLRRLGRSPNPRPLLAGDPAGRLATLAAERDELYRQLCTVTVDTAGRSVGAVTELILRELPR